MDPDEATQAYADDSFPRAGGDTPGSPLILVYIVPYPRLGGDRPFWQQLTVGQCTFPPHRRG